MADGIFQTGAGATITLQNDTHADADLDGINDVYSAEDIDLKGLASGDCIDHNTNHRSYRFKATIQNGDGTGTAATTFKESNVVINFDNTKTYLVSATGAANRRTEFGALVQGAAGKPSGKDGVQMLMGAACTLRGQILLYNSYLKTSAGNINIIPGSAGLVGEIINCIMQSAGSFAIGQDTTGNLQRIFNLDLTSFASNVSGAVTNWGADFAERVTVATNTANNFIRTGARIRIKDLVLIGTLQGLTPADLSNTGVNEWDIVNPIWSGNANQYGVVNANVNEWFGYGIQVVNRDTGDPVANVPVKVTDVFGSVVVNAITDSNGHISFGTVGDVTENALKVRRRTNAALFNYFYPFTVQVNQTGAINSGFSNTNYKKDWPFTDLPSGFGQQFYPVYDIVPLLPIGSSSWFEVPVDVAS